MSMSKLRYKVIVSRKCSSQKLKANYFQYFSDPFTTYPFSSILSSCPW